MANRLVPTRKLLRFCYRVVEVTSPALDAILCMQRSDTLMHGDFSFTDSIAGSLPSPLFPFASSVGGQRVRRGYSPTSLPPGRPRADVQCHCGPASTFNFPFCDLFVDGATACTSVTAHWCATLTPLPRAASAWSCFLSRPLQRHLIFLFRQHD